jgi:hypothetical protein
MFAMLIFTKFDLCVSPQFTVKLKLVLALGVAESELLTV